MKRQLIVALTALFVIPSVAQKVPMDYSYCGYHRSESPIPSMKIAAFVMSILAILVSSVTLFSCLDKKKAWKRSEMQGQKMLWLLVFIAVVILIPILLNYIIRRPAVIEIVGDETDWLAFHGSYIGAIVGAGISFLIMYLTLNYYKKEDKYKHEVSRNDYI